MYPGGLDQRQRLAALFSSMRSTPSLVIIAEADRIAQSQFNFAVHSTPGNARNDRDTGFSLDFSCPECRN